MYLCRRNVYSYQPARDCVYLPVVVKPAPSCVLLPVVVKFHPSESSILVSRIADAGGDDDREPKLSYIFGTHSSRPSIAECTKLLKLLRHTNEDQYIYRNIIYIRDARL